MLNAVLNSAAAQVSIGFGSSGIGLPVNIKGSYRNVSTGVFAVVCSGMAGTNGSGDYLLWSNVSGYKLRVNFLQAFNELTTSSELIGFSWTSASPTYFQTYLQPQQGWNANLVGANFVGLSGASFYVTMVTLSGGPVAVTAIGEAIPNSWVEGANA